MAARTRDAATLPEVVKIRFSHRKYQSLATTRICRGHRWIDSVQSFAINAACSRTVGLASSCLSGAQPSSCRMRLTITRYLSLAAAKISIALSVPRTGRESVGFPLCAFSGLLALPLGLRVLAGQL